MHYYQFNIKDYSFATIRMSLMEDLAFRRMLDLFYESENPLPFELKRIAKLIGMTEHQEEIRDVLNEFWTETESGWVNSRAQEEITKYQSKADAARLNGKKGGRPSKPKKTQSVILANPEKSESKANHKPITINQEPVNNICQQVADEYNDILPELGMVKVLSDKRKAWIRASIKQMSKTDHDFTDIRTWTKYFNYVSKSEFLMGQKSDWSATFDFLVNKNNLLKVVEGTYE